MKKYICLFFRIYLIIILPIAYSKVNHRWNVPAKITYKECTKDVCKEQADDIITCMNHYANPCEDFYEYVCGNWSHQYIDPKKQYRTFPFSVESVMEYKAYEDIRSTLEQPINSHDDEYEIQAKKLYKACMNLPWLKQMDAAELKPIVAKAGPWPMFPQENENDESYSNWVPIHNYYLKLTGESALFGLAVRTNPISKLPALELRKSLSPYGLFIRLAPWTMKETNGYITFLNAIAQDVKPANAIKIPSNMLHKDIENVLEFRKRVMKVINGLDKQSQTGMTIDYLNTWYNDKLAIRKKIAEIPWLQVIKALYASDKNVHIHEKTVILLSHSPYFEGLRTILNKATSRTIINHIHLYFIERHLRLTEEHKDLYHAVRSLAPSDPVSKKRVFAEKWYSCIEKHALPNTLGRMYIEDYSSLTIREKIKDMIREAKDMVMLQISDAAWLEDKTKTASKFKVDQIKTSIGYPRWYDNPSKRQQYQNVGMLPHHPEAKYCIQKNKIYVTASYFQPPFYDVCLPFHMKYAALGSLLAHEVYHSLDIKGLWFDVEGKKSIWWPREMITVYNVKRECFLRLYSNFKIKEFEGYSDAPTRTYSFETMEEDIADAMGLKAAYEMYRYRLLQENHICSSLPRLSQYNCEQMFFISFARTFCFAATPRELMFTAKYDEHNTPRIRVNAAVSNMKEFSDAFKCAANAPLNPKRKCDLWE